MRYLSAPDLFEAPDPDLVADWNLVHVARWMRVAPWELLERHGYWLELGQLGLEFENEQAKKGNKAL